MLNDIVKRGLLTARGVVGFWRANSKVVIIAIIIIIIIIAFVFFIVIIIELLQANSKVVKIIIIVVLAIVFVIIIIIVGFMPAKYSDLQGDDVLVFDDSGKQTATFHGLRQQVVTIVLV